MTQPTAPEPMTPAVIMGLTGQVDELIDKLDVMEERRRMDRRVWVIGIAVVVMLCIVSVVVAISTAVLATGNRENVNTIKDCTQAGGECFEEGQRRTGEAVSLLIRQNLAVHECRLLPEVQTPEQLAACVELELREPAPDKE